MVTTPTGPDISFTVTFPVKSMPRDWMVVFTQYFISIRLYFTTPGRSVFTRPVL